MRVALLSRAVLPLHGYGGLERHVAALDKYLRLEGCEVTLYTMPPDSNAGAQARDGTVFVPYRLLPWPRRSGFVILDRNTNYLGWSVRAGRRLLADRRPDVVQADGGAGFGYALFSRGGSPPLVLHPHGMEEFEAPPLRRALYQPLRSAVRYAARHAARVVAPDASMKDDVRRHLGVPEEKVVVMPNAIDLAEIDRPAPEVDLGIPERERVLLSVGRLDRNKGFSFLAQALARIREDFLWVLVGSGPERGSLEAEIDRMGLSDRARLTGGVPDEMLHALYDRCALFLHPTLYEGSSQVTLEAMAHGKAIVASRVGGIPDKVVDGENGLLVTPGNVEALAQAISNALASPDRLRIWGAKSRAMVEMRFSWSKRVKELLALYQQILKKEE
jgi:glycosyltransferase involved in cell wall biosynthesis